MITGIDFSFSRVPPAVAAAAGYRFAVSYLTDLDTSHRAKAWTSGEVASYRAAGLGVVAVWQGGGADRTTAWRGGYARGARDARLAAQQSGALGRPEGAGGRPVYFAIDSDVSDAELSLVSAYFDGVASVFDVANIGVYGGRRVIVWAQQSRKASWFWQTGAWSAGVKVPGIHLYQRAPETRLGPYSVDVDEALRDDYGQWFDVPGGGGVAGTLWIPGAQRIGQVSGGSMDSPNLPPRVVWHTVESPTGSSYFRSMADYLLREGVWPQVLYDPETDQLGQYCALNEAGRALRNDGSTRSNRVGKVCIQIEVLGRAAQPFTEQSTWRPGPNFRALMAAIRSWGIPDRFPMGNPPRYPGSSTRDRSIWLGQAGHYAHANVPGNDHGDPGAINPSKLFAAAGTTSPAKPVPPAPSPVVEEDDMKVLGGELKPGFDPVSNLAIPPSVPAGKRLFLNVGVDMGRVRGRVDVFTTSGGWQKPREFDLKGDDNLAFWQLPDDARKVNIKRLPGEGIDPATPAAWNVEVV